MQLARKLSTATLSAAFSLTELMAVCAILGVLAFEDAEQLLLGIRPEDGLDQSLLGSMVERLL